MTVFTQNVLFKDLSCELSGKRTIIQGTIACFCYSASWTLNWCSFDVEAMMYPMILKFQVVIGEIKLNKIKILALGCETWSMSKIDLVSVFN